jgi:hypothetical protein
VVGPVVARILPAVIVMLATGLPAAQAPPVGAPGDGLTAAQRRLLAGWAPGTYDAAPEPFRVAFEQVTRRLSSLLLSDPENGEVLGAALDLIESVEPPDRQPAGGEASPTLQLSVTLAAGARDRLRRAGEFGRVSDSAPGRVEFLHEGPPAIRISADAAGSRAQIAVVRR